MFKKESYKINLHLFSAYARVVWKSVNKKNCPRESIFSERMSWWFLYHFSSLRRFISWWRHQMETLPRCWPFVRGIHRSPVNSPHKGQWRGALMSTLICARINDWINNRKAGDLRRYRAHYDVIVMSNSPIVLHHVIWRTVCLSLNDSNDSVKGVELNV